MMPMDRRRIAAGYSQTDLKLQGNLAEQTGLPES